jgi:NAD(P)-dependent dehydrogenase (short-subunit alcohol dehydrogenase family)
VSIIERLFGLANRVALVTGAGSGIGRAIASALADAGAAVVLVGRRREALDATRESLESRGGKAAVLPCDLAVRESLDDCARRA